MDKWIEQNWSFMKFQNYKNLRSIKAKFFELFMIFPNYFMKL